MHRERNSRIIFQCIAVIFTGLILPGIAASQSATVTDPPGFHLLLRLEGGKATYKLGEAIHFEVSCNSDLPQRYSSTCGDESFLPFTEVEVVALDSRSKLALDPVETHWIGRTLCPFTQGGDDSFGGEKSILYVGGEVHWRTGTFSEHYPMLGRRVGIRVVVRGSVV